MSIGTDVPELARDAAWQRLDARMLLVHPIRELLRFWPVLLGVVVAGGAGSEGTWQLLAVALPIVVGLLRYLTTSFRISGGRVELRRGLVSRHVLSTPVDRVRTVDLTSSPIHRVLGLTTVRIGTGISAGDDDALDLDGLPTGRARELRRELLEAGDVAAAAGGDPALASVPTDQEVLSFDPAWVRLAPLTGSGLVVAVAAVGVLTQVLDVIGARRLLDPQRWRLASSATVATVIGVLVLVVVVAVLSVLGYLVTNGGFRLSRSPTAWHVRRGLLTTRETSLDPDRVAGVVVVEPLLLRLAGAAHLTAIVSGIDREQRGSSMLVPPAPGSVVTRTAATVLAGRGPVVTALRSHGPAARRRRWTRALVPAVLLAAALVGLGLTTGPRWLAGLAALVVVAGAALAADRSAALGHALVEDHLVARSGSVVRRREVLGAGHVIGWTFRSTWWQRRAGLTTLVATTAGGRQRVSVLDVPDAEAVALAAATMPALADFLDPPGVASVG